MDFIKWANNSVFWIYHSRKMRSTKPTKLDHVLAPEIRRDSLKPYLSSVCVFKNSTRYLKYLHNSTSYEGIWLLCGKTIIKISNVVWWWCWETKHQNQSMAFPLFVSDFHLVIKIIVVLTKILLCIGYVGLGFGKWEYWYLDTVACCCNKNIYEKVPK